ncbi:MAG: hypothetical protein Fur0037_24700 [Planctomycetota bacterium]
MWISAFLTILLAPWPQEAPPHLDPCKAFSALDPGLKPRVLGAIEHELMLDQDPVIQRIVSLQRGLDSYEAQGPRPYFDESLVRGALPRRRIGASDPASEAVAAKFPRPPFLPDLRREVAFDWIEGKAKRTGRLSAEDRVANLAAGYLPGSDHAVAGVLQVLAGPASPATAWFEHLYADRQGRVYEQVRLYDAWYSGELLEVPDVDAIAFARSVLGDYGLASPIPRGRIRDDLYRKIADAALAQRRFRSVLEVAAATFVCAAPRVDPTYAPLVDRLHYLWAAAGDDPKSLSAMLRERMPSDPLLERIDEEIERTRGGWKLREEHRRRLREVQMRVRGLLAARIAGASNR